VLGVIAVLLCCVLALIGGAQEVHEFRGVTYAEGYSSKTPAEAVHLGFRQFSLGSNMCLGVPVPVRLEVSPSEVTLRPGERFDLQTVRLRAFNAKGAFVPSTPLSAGMRYHTDVMDLDSDNDAHFEVVAKGPGVGSATFGAFCGERDHPLEIAITIDVVNGR
jgi:hypothetical protein